MSSSKKSSISRGTKVKRGAKSTSSTGKISYVTSPQGESIKVGGAVWESLFGTHATVDSNESLSEEGKSLSGEESIACYRPRSLTLEDAINRLKSVRYLGLQGQVVWTLVQRNHPPIAKYLEDEDFISGTDICFAVAEYLRFWLSDEDLASMEQIYMEKLEKNNWLCLED